MPPDRITAKAAGKLVCDRRGGRVPLEVCIREADFILSLVAAPGPSYITAVRIAGVRVARE